MSSAASRVPEYLNTLGAYEGRDIKTVYEFLKASRFSPLGILQTCLFLAKQTYSHPGMTVLPPHLEAADALCSELKDAFQTEDSHKNWLRRIALWQLDNELCQEFSIRIVDGKVSANDFIETVEECQEKGLTEEDAMYYAYEFFVLENNCLMPSLDPVKTRRQEIMFCSICNTRNKKGSLHCKKCGIPLVIKCPVCKQSVSLDKAHCKQKGCGYDLGIVPPVLFRIKEGKEKIAQGDIAAARLALATALDMWPDNPDAKKLWLLLPEAAAKKAQEELKKRIREHLSNIFLAGEITTTIKNSEAGQYVTLSWEPASVINPSLGTDSSKILYIVRRKENGFPTSIKDGFEIGRTTQTTIDDNKPVPVPGMTYGYSVFLCYDGYTGSSPKNAPQKITTVTDVTNLQVIPGDSFIQLKWDKPKRSIGAICVRKEGSIPSSATDGIQLPIGAATPVVAESEMVDNCLVNLHRYGYRVFAVFKDTEGALRTSDGVTCMTFPAEPPPMLTDLSYMKKHNDSDEVPDNDVIHLTWTPIAKCRVRLYSSPTPVRMPPGKCFLVENDKEYKQIFAPCKELLPVDQDKGNAEVNLSSTDHQNGLLYLIPVTIQDGVAAIGKSLLRLPSVSNLEGTRRGGTLEITWDWPPDCRSVRLLLRMDSMPTSPDDPLASRETVQHRLYNGEKLYRLENAGDRTYYCAIYTQETVDGKPVFSTPARQVFPGRSHICYSIRRDKGWLGIGGKKVVLDVYSPDGTMPELVLLKKNGAMPLTRADGTPVTTIASQNCHHTTQKLTIEGGVFLRLFCSNKADDSNYLIEPPLSMDYK